MPPLASDAILTDTLRSVDEVLAGKSVTESVAGTIAQLLARESFFGEDVMAQCTPQGSRFQPALPCKELLELKKVLVTKLPECHAGFEAFGANA